jgi:cysteine desulfuration protein SufE
MANQDSPLRIQFYFGMDNKDLEQRKARILKQFQGLTTWEEKYGRIIELGATLEPFPESEKITQNLIFGCTSQVWLIAQFNEKNGLVEYVGDSDSVIVKGLLAVLVKVYTKSKPAVILSDNIEFLEKLEFTKYLTPSRANGLWSILRQIRAYALAFQHGQKHRD